MLSPLPTIEISFAPPEDPKPEPFSPFTPANGFFQDIHNGCDQDDRYRPSLLTPPPMRMPTPNPLDSFAMKKQGQGRGIGAEEFAALLRASKERTVSVAKRSQDLRKEVTLKAHKTKQFQRRALFLSKIGAPPSPTAVSLPKTPPESPAIFHYTLPSPGLHSPLALFEELDIDNEDGSKPVKRQSWVEQVDFRLPAMQSFAPISPSVASSEKQDIPEICVTGPTLDSSRRFGHARKTSLPSLDQITERYSERGSMATSPPTPRVRAPLPAFLSGRAQPPVSAVSSELSNSLENVIDDMETKAEEVKETSERPRPLRLASTGRIQFLVRSPPSPSPPVPHATAPVPPPPKQARRRVLGLTNTSLSPIPSKMPLSPTTPTIQVTPTNVSCNASNLSSFTFGDGRKLERASLTEANLAALDSRARTARDMLSAVRRRTTVVSHLPSKALAQSKGEKLRMHPQASQRPLVHTSLEDGAAEMLRKLGAKTYASEYEKMQRRNSAPAELTAAKKRYGVAFSHSVLAIPGGF